MQTVLYTDISKVVLGKITEMNVYIKQKIINNLGYVLQTQKTKSKMNKM